MVVVGRLDRSVRLEVWLDLYSGQPSPRVWVGAYARSAAPIERLGRLLVTNGPFKSVLRRTGRDIRRREPLRFVRPLTTDEFDVPVLERYSGNYYLGVYFPYAWPLSRSDIRALIRDTVNLIAILRDTNRLPSPQTARIRRVGPWNQPDPVIDASAIGHVTRVFRARGYRVRSREDEICGFDLEVARGDERLDVEVKGTSGPEPVFFISRKQLTASTEDRLWRLAVVLEAVTRPRMLRLLTGRQMRNRYAFEPIKWRCVERGR